MGYWKRSLLFLFYTFIIYQGCNINEPFFPSWDVSLNIPIMKRNYTLLELIEKSKELSYYKEGTSKNLIYYSKEETINEIDLQNQLKINSFTKSSSKSIGTIKVSADSITSEIDFSWIGLGITPGMKSAVPQIVNSPIESSLNAVNEFTYVKLNSGTIDFTIKNNFPSPVAVTLTNLIIRDYDGSEVVASYTPAIVLAPNETKTIKQIPLATGIYISNQLKFECNISTAGSGGAQIIFPQSSFSIKIRFNNLEVAETVAKIPVQNPIVIDNATTIDEGNLQPTKFTNVKIDAGTLSLTLSNNLDVDADITLSSENLRTPQNQAFSLTKSILRKQQNISLLSNLSIKDYSLVSLNGIPTNQVTFSITIKTIATNDKRTLKSSDGLSGTVSISDLVIKEFSGQLKPQSIATERTSTSLNIKDLTTKLQFQQLNLKNPLVQFLLTTNAQFEFKVNGYIEARKSNGQKVILGLNYKTLDTTIISPTNSTISIRSDSLSKFFSQFSSLPDSLIAFVGGIVNPSYKTVFIKSTDKVSGKTRIELPLEFAISNAVYKDSLNIDLTDDDRDKIKNVNTFAATLKINSSIPASIQFSSRLYDSANNFLIDFPSANGQPSSININGAATSETTISLSKTEAEKVSRASYMRSTIIINTSSGGIVPVQLKTTDYLDINAFGSTNYRVKSSGDSK